MRIVGGSLRGRTLTAPDSQMVRPTSDRIRQAVFNILEHATWAPDFSGAHVLDAFCGTGALAFEALSRGAEHACLLDVAQSSVKLAQRNAADLGLATQAATLRADATKPPVARDQFSLVFLDPPYDRGLIPLAVTALANRGWFAPGAVLVLETRLNEPLPPPDTLHCTLLDARNWGDTAVHFWQHLPPTPPV
jgi:16S rRNA (guanine966-N2)-methyltransferase